ncbi:MAG: 4Fe-4S binding protein [Candidatus Bathyarchaeota archaeon]
MSGFILPVTAYLYGRRIYCSFLCQVGTYTETVGDLWRHKAIRGKRADRIALIGGLTVLFALIIINLGFDDFGLIRRAHVIHSIFNLIYLYFFMTAFLFGATPFMSSRAFCKFICPLGRILGEISKRGRFQINTDGGECINCYSCNNRCHMGIDVNGYVKKGIPVRNSHCVGCGFCIHHCTQKVLYFKTVPALAPRKKVVVPLAEPTVR